MKSLFFTGMFVIIAFCGAQSQTQILKNSSHNNGGLLMQDSSYSSTTTVGEAATATISSTSYSLRAGFQATLFAGAILPGTEAQFLSYSFAEETGPALINDIDHRVVVEVTDGTDLTHLVATFTLSRGAVAKVDTIRQVSGSTANDFTDPVNYIITSEDGQNITNWLVIVNAGGTTDDQAPVITEIDMPEEFPNSDDNVTATVKVTDNMNLDLVKFIYRKFEDSNWTQKELSSSTDSYSVDISKSDMGTTGMQYYFRATDIAQNVNSTSIHSLVFTYGTDDSPAIPSLTFGASVSNYQILSIPLDLDNKNVTAVFNDLGEYDIKQWRLFHYDGSTKEYGQGFTTIDPGKGYWLIVRTSKTINVGSGKTLGLDAEGNYTIQLKPGFNQVGNPFNYTLNWDDVIGYNNDGNIGRVKLYSSGTLSEGNSIARFRGGFVYLDGSNTVDVKIPSATSTSSRIMKGGLMETLAGNPIDGKNWALPIDISNGQVSNKLTAIGMSEEAQISKDRLDDILLPVPSSICSYQLYFPHNEFHDPRFSRDFVPDDEYHVWDVILTSANPGETITLSWDNTNFGNNDKTLILEDAFRQQLINLREEDHYEIKASGDDNFRIYFGNSEDLKTRILPKEISLGNPFPNPFNREVTIPFALPDFGSMAVRVSIYNTSGSEVAELINSNLSGGYYSATWRPLEGNEGFINGLYLIHVQVNYNGTTKSLTKKIIYNH